MPSFDIVSQIDSHELNNAVDQANREISNRFDFKGTDSRIEIKDNMLTLRAPAEFQIKQIQDILENKLSKRRIDVGCLDYASIQERHNETRQEVTVRQGIDKELARKLVKFIKDMKLKLQASIQGDQVRVSGKKRDDLQKIISSLTEQEMGMPLQFINFRD